MKATEQRTAKGMIAALRNVCILGAIGGSMATMASAADPCLIGSYQTNGLNSPKNVTIVNDRAYVAVGNTGMEILDISDRTNPILLGSYTQGGATDIAVSNEIAYVASGGRLKIIDVSNPGSPTLLATMAPGVVNRAAAVVVAGSTAYVADTTNGLYIYDVSIPNAPFILGNHGQGMGHDLVIDNGFAYVVGATPTGVGLAIFDVGDSTDPVLVGWLDLGTVLRLTVKDGIAYIAQHHLGLSMVDVSNPAAPGLIRTFITPNRPNDVVVHGTTAYVADDWGGLRVLDVSNPALPTITSRYPTSQPAVGLAVTDGVVYLATKYQTGHDTVFIVDPSGECGEPCVADLNGDGSLGFGDISMFIDAFGAGDLTADFNGDGVLDFFDIASFLGAFRMGCP